MHFNFIGLFGFPSNNNTKQLNTKDWPTCNECNMQLNRGRSEFSFSNVMVFNNLMTWRAHFPNNVNALNRLDHFNDHSIALWLNNNDNSSSRRDVGGGGGNSILLTLHYIFNSIMVFCLFKRGCGASLIEPHTTHTRTQALM